MQMTLTIKHDFFMICFTHIVVLVVQNVNILDRMNLMHISYHKYNKWKDQNNFSKRKRLFNATRHMNYLKDKQIFGGTVFLITNVSNGNNL